MKNKFEMTVAEYEEIYGTKLPIIEKTDVINNCDSAYFEIIRVTDLNTADVEKVWIVALDQSNRVIESFEVSTGENNKSMFPQREAFRKLIKLNAPSFVMAHNHPSGNPDASFQDIALTKKINDSSDILGLNFVDHLIITKHGYSSIKRDHSLQGGF